MRKREEAQKRHLEEKPQGESVRLQKYMAACGVASRRHCEELIRAGRVRVNGQTVETFGTKIDPARDRVTLDGAQILPPAKGHVYYMLNKPQGYLVTARDERGRRTIFELLGSLGERVVAVGRLDMNSEGLLLLTNDGELAHRLMHPAFRVEKEYVVRVEGKLDEAACAQLRAGVEIGDGRTQPARVEVIERGEKSTRVRVTICEGRKRQVRRMMDAVGHPVQTLKRVREGTLRLGALPSGELRALTAQEVRELKEETGLKDSV